jgi:serine/threonine protein kinase
MSPEQCQGNMQDRRSDIYSLGCVMYEALTGVQPFAEVNPVRVILRHVNEDARAISTLKQAYNVPLDLDKIIMHCLARDPALRYQSADDLVRDLKKVRDGEKLKLRQPLKAKTQSESLNPASTARRTRIRLVIFGTLSALLSIFAMLMIQHAPPPGNPFTGRDPYADAEALDQQAFYYFSRGEYDKAAPLLEFGIKVYRDLLAGARQRNDDYGIRKLSALMNEDLQHLGKCYLKMAEAAPSGSDSAEVANLLQKAKAAYDAAYPFYKQYGNYAGSQFPEFVTDYAQVLRKLSLQKELDSLREFARLNRVVI